MMHFLFCLLLSFPALSAEPPAKAKEAIPLELAELSSALALPAGAKPNVLGDWKQLEAVPLAGKVEWKKETGKKSGTKEMRQGQVEFLLPGQVSVSGLLTVKGEANGFPSARLVTGAMEKEEEWTFQDFEAAISAKGGSLKAVKCDALGSKREATIGAGLQLPGKNPLWLVIEKVCSDFGCVYSLDWHLQKERFENLRGMGPDCKPALAFFGGGVPDSKAKVAESKPFAMELPQLARELAFPSGNKTQALQSWLKWKEAAFKNIEWKTAQPEIEGADWSHRADFRVLLRGKKIPSEYVLQVHGSKAGFTHVKLNSLAVNYENGEFAYEELSAFEKAGAKLIAEGCDSNGMASDATAYSRVEFPGKAPLWLKKEISGGSHGDSIDYELFLGKAEFDAVTGITKECEPNGAPKRKEDQ